jgi:hypothetical protein
LQLPTADFPPSLALEGGAFIQSMNQFNPSSNQGATIFPRSQKKTVRLEISPTLFDFFDAIQQDDIPPKDANSLNALFEWLDKMPFERQFFELAKGARRHSIELRHFRAAFEFWQEECRDTSGAFAQHGGQS